MKNAWPSFSMTQGPAIRKRGAFGPSLISPIEKLTGELTPANAMGKLVPFDWVPDYSALRLFTTFNSALCSLPDSENRAKARKHKRLEDSSTYHGNACNGTGGFASCSSREAARATNGPRRLSKASTEPVRTGLAGLRHDVIFRNSLIISRIIYARRRALSTILSVQLEASLAEKLGFYEKP